MTSLHSPGCFILVYHVSDVGPELHEVLHDEALVPLQWKVELFHFHNSIQQVQELWHLLFVLSNKSHYFLHLVATDLHTCVGISSEYLPI